ncbi:alpha/beta hydrolase [Alicyclobacillus fodiniaquatilis]|jgi:pimeloyl-ACP methyl ester carboxylesterase|uniref:Alpha/beta hydrolase n=1 Tax=Alicyclobacillus fodiniaquatilis TaxID=1661150 RepID=A0ABW4JCC5_9BACL
MEKLVSFQGPDFTLFGVEHKADNAAGYILSCCGLNGDRTDIHRIGVQFARCAARKGFSALRFDYRGHGVSDEAFQRTSLVTKIQDIECVLGHLDPELPLYVIGFSDGVHVAGYLAERYPNRVRGVVLWSPLYTSLHSARQAKVKIAKDKLYKELASPMLGLWFGMPYLKSLKIPMSIPTVPQPLLIVYGASDPQVFPTVQGLMDKNAHAEQVEIPDANHVYSDVRWKDQVFATTMDFLQKHSSHSSKEDVELYRRQGEIS